MKAKKIFLIFIVSFFVLISVFSFALAHTEENAKSLEEIVEGVLKNQNISDTKQIDCSKVSDLEFEELGDAVMEKMIGSHELHEQMDAMMGGEGSQSLIQMHQAMGKNWLGCGSSFGGMMGGMGPMMMRMMGNYYPAYYSGYDLIMFLGILGWVLFVVVVIFLLFGTRHTKLKKK